MHKSRLAALVLDSKVENIDSFLRTNNEIKKLNCIC